MFQFNHARAYSTKPNQTFKSQGGVTFALDVPSRSDLERFLQFEDPRLVLDFGKAVCHPKENYNKATGRFLSANRSVPTTFVLKDIVLKKDKRHFHLSTISGDVTIILTGTVTSNKLYFTEIY